SVGRLASAVAVLARLLASLLLFRHAATAAICALSLHDALPICPRGYVPRSRPGPWRCGRWPRSSSVRRRDADWQSRPGRRRGPRSEEHTSELQSRENLVCRLLLEKKKKNTTRQPEPDQPDHATD